jgi:hypothetical protein
LYLSTVSVSRFTKKKFPDFPLFQVFLYAQFEIPPGLAGGLTKQKMAEPPRLAGGTYPGLAGGFWLPTFAMLPKIKNSYTIKLAAGVSLFIRTPFYKKSQNGDLIYLSTSQARGAALMYCGPYYIGL